MSDTLLVLIGTFLGLMVIGLPVAWSMIAAARLRTSAVAASLGAGVPARMLRTNESNPVLTDCWKLVSGAAAFAKIASRASPCASVSGAGVGSAEAAGVVVSDCCT